MVIINIEEKGSEKQDSQFIEHYEFGFERDDQTFVENVEYRMNPKAMDEMLTSILKDLETAEVSLHSTSHLLEPTVNSSESNPKSQEITEIKPLPTAENLNLFPQKVKNNEVGEFAFNFQNFNGKDNNLIFHEQELKHLPLCLEQKKKGFESSEKFEEETSPSKELPSSLETKEKSVESPKNLQEETSLSKDLKLCLEPKEKSFESPEHLEEKSSPSKDFPLCPEPKIKCFECTGHLEEETSHFEENNSSISILKVDNKNNTKEKAKSSEEIEHQTAPNKPEDKTLFNIPFLSSNPYINFVQDFQAKYTGDEVTPSMLATLALTKWRKMGMEEKQVYKNIKKNNCEKNQQVKKLKKLIKTLNASEETIFSPY